MGELKIEVDAAEVGLDAARLGRLDAYYDRLVEAGTLAGYSALVSRHGKIAHLVHSGRRDVEADLPVDGDTIFRFGSLTKPIVAVATMMLYEEGAFDLHDPVSKFVPSFGETRVYRDGPTYNPNTDPLAEPIRIWHLLTHTAGLTYGAWQAHPVEQLYAQAGFLWDAPATYDLAQACDALAGLPLLFQPGTRWNYGFSVDVLGRIIEVVTGQRIDDVVTERVLRPLGMDQTTFWVAPEEAHRIATMYSPDPQAEGRVTRNEPFNIVHTERPTFVSPGGGLFGTVGDYHRFTQLLLGRGELEGTRLLGGRTVDFMTRNQLPGGVDLGRFGRRVMFGQPTYDGLGFGLGFQTVVDDTATKLLVSPAEYSWYAGYTTLFLVDPVSRLTALFFAQLHPVRTFPTYSRVRQFVNQALVD